MIANDDYDEWDYAQVAFARERRVACTRKEHPCEVCHYAIPAGVTAVTFARKDADTAEGHIDYGYLCAWDGPCFDPAHLRNGDQSKPMEVMNDPPF